MSMNAERPEMEYEPLVCQVCGSSDWDYIGEAYDDEYYMGCLYECKECGHQQIDEDGQ